MNARPHVARTRAAHLLPLAGALVLGALAAPGLGQCEELARLVPSNAAAFDRAGTSTAINGDLAVVGSPFADPMGTNSGAATVFRYDGSQWVEEQILSAADGVAGDEFGTAVGVADGAIFVGAPLHDFLGTDSGAVYAYRMDAGVWTLEKKILAGDGNPSDEFGTRISMDANLALIGAPGREVGAAGAAGAVYAFEYKNAFLNWSETQKLVAPNAASSELFGQSVSIRGAYVAVGCPSRNTAVNTRAGAAFTYESISGTWTLLDELRASDGTNFDSFGWSVAIDYPQMIVGSPGDDEVGNAAGAVYFYAHTGTVWNETKVANPRNEGLTFFGRAVAMDGNAALVGTDAANAVGSDSGIADSYRLYKGDWYHDQVIGSTSLSSSDFFGSNLAISGTRAIIGAPRDDTNGTDDGAAFIHSFNELLLTASDTSPSEGDSLAFSSVCGTPGTPCFFTVDQIDGSPFFQILFFSNFASNHEFAFSTSTPPGLAGTSISFRTYRIASWGQVLGSNSAVVDFQ